MCTNNYSRQTNCSDDPNPNLVINIVLYIGLEYICFCFYKISTPTHLRLKTLRKNTILTPVILVVRRMREVGQDLKVKKVRGGRYVGERILSTLK